MALEIQYKDQIQRRMKAEYQKISGKTVIEGGFARDIISANSLEFENTYLELNMIYEASFADTSWGDFLTRKCAEFGVDRKKATYSIGEVTFKGDKNRTIPAGTIVEIIDGNQYITDEAAVTDENGEATVAITCSIIGSTGNVSENMITSIPYPIHGISSVTNIEATHDGYDEETDDELFERYVIYMRTPATSGNIYHYYNWAGEVEGVGIRKVIPLWDGPGTVKVLFFDSNGQPASEELLQKVYEHIEEVRPIGALVTVSTPEYKMITIEVDGLKGILDTDLMKEEIHNFVLSKGLDLKYLSAAKVADIIMNQASVIDYDYESLLLNKGRRVTFTEEETPLIGEVIINANNA